MRISHSVTTITSTGSSATGPLAKSPSPRANPIAATWYHRNLDVKAGCEQHHDATMQGSRMPSEVAAVPSTRISSVEARMAMDHNPALTPRNRRPRRNVNRQVSAMPTELKNRHASEVGPSTRIGTDISQ